MIKKNKLISIFILLTVLSILGHASGGIKGCLDQTVDEDCPKCKKGLVLT